MTAVSFDISMSLDGNIAQVSCSSRTSHWPPLPGWGPGRHSGTLAHRNTHSPGEPSATGLDFVARPLLPAIRRPDFVVFERTTHL